MIELAGTWDRDQGPIQRFEVRDDDGPRDFASAACEVFVHLEDGTLVARRPAVVVSPKADGLVDVLLRGRETDWDGLGKVLILKPRLYYATAPDGTPATNLLLNPSFDTDANLDGIADNWSLQGAKTGVWAVYANDAAPASIFGNFQLVDHFTTGDPDYIQQSFAGQSFVPGDELSVGCWHRYSGGQPVAKNDNNAIFFRTGANPNEHVQFESGPGTERDWYFAYGSLLCSTSETTCVMGIDARGFAASHRHDEAFFFKGWWRIRHGEPVRYPVRARYAIPKTGGNLLDGFGSFEEDSDGDGFPDSWRNDSPTNTFSVDRTPANVAHGAASLKVALADATNQYVKIIERGHFKVGEVWKASVRVKTDGPLTTGAAPGFSIQIRTQNFDPPTLLSAATNFGTDLAAFTDYSAQITLDADRDELEVRIYVSGYVGTAWLDDVRLTRVST